MNMSAPKRPRIYDKKEDYTTIEDFMMKNPGHKKEFYIGNIAMVCGYSEEKSEEAFRMLKFAGRITIDENGAVQMLNEGIKLTEEKIGE